VFGYAIARRRVRIATPAELAQIFLTLSHLLSGSDPLIQVGGASSALAEGGDAGFTTQVNYGSTAIQTP